MKQGIRFALIGCGKIAKKHAESILSTGSSQLVAVADTNEQAARNFAQAYDASWHKNYHEMLAKEDVDVVCVLTPSGSHYAICMDIFDYGKHMVVEKPLTLRLDEANDLLRRSHELGVKLFVVKQYRFHEPVQKLYEAIKKDRFGKIVMATARIRWCRPQHYYDQAAWRGTWAEDGGVFVNQAIHQIDLLQWLVGPVDSITAKSATMLTNVEVEDVGIAIIKFNSGALGLIEATTCVRPRDIESSISIMGEKGIVEIGGLATNQIKNWNFQNSLPEDQEILGKYSAEDCAKNKVGHERMYKHIVEALQSSNGHNGKNSNGFLVDALEARKGIELINAIYESIETGQEIQLRFRPSKCRLGRVQQ